MSALDINTAFAAPLCQEEIASGAALPASAGSALQSVTPVSADAPAPVFNHFKLGRPSATWTYKDSQGERLGYICRFDTGEDDKEFMPLTCWRDAAGQLAWQWRSWPRPRPLYGLDRLAKSLPSQAVVVVESEKCADAAAPVFSDCVVVTSPGGANAPATADWSPLLGRDVIIWPDNDEPGRRYSQVVAEGLQRIANSIAVIDGAALARITPTCEAREPKPGWDVADAVKEGWGPRILRSRAIALAKSWHRPACQSHGAPLADSLGDRIPPLANPQERAVEKSAHQLPLADGLRTPGKRIVGLGR